MGMEVYNMTNEKKGKKEKLINYFCLGIFVLIVIFVLMLFLYWSDQHSFTQTKWREDIEIRSLIVDDLLNDYELIGMTKQEIEDLLGKNNNDYGYFNRENRYVYCLGGARTIIDSEWLLIDFEGDLVINYEITTD